MRERVYYAGDAYETVKTRDQYHRQQYHTTEQG